MRAWLKAITLVMLLFGLIPGSHAEEEATRSRPDPESGATTVRVDLYILDITRIDNVVTMDRWSRALFPGAYGVISLVFRLG